MEWDQGWKFYYGSSLKNLIFRGWLCKTNIKGGLPKKGGLDSFIDLRGELSKGEEGLGGGGDTPVHTMGL